MVTATDITNEMQYGFSWFEESLSVAGYTIEIQHDQDAGNPYTDSEGNSPALWLDLDRNSPIKEYGDSDLESFFWKMSPDWISRHWRKLCDVLDLSHTLHDTQARAQAKDNRQHLSNARLVSEYHMCGIAAYTSSRPCANWKG